MIYTPRRHDERPDLFNGEGGITLSFFLADPFVDGFFLLRNYHIVIVRSDEGLTLETSALYPLRWPIYIFNLVDITKLSYKEVPCPESLSHWHD